MVHEVVDVSTHPDFDGHERVFHCEEPSNGLRAFIAIHDTTLGQGMGGCRMQRYADDGKALSDALRLSRGMTYKYAVSGLHYGGAKGVIIDNGRSPRKDVLRAFAGFVEELEGQYTTAEDAGIDTADVRLMSETTRYIRNLPLEDTGDGALCTAWGVFHGIRAGLEHRGMIGVAGKKVAVEGLGKVGMMLCSLLDKAGSYLTVYDIDPEKVRIAQARFSADASAAGQIHASEADVYAPCALGGVLNVRTVPEIKATIIAGAANNQLGDQAVDNVMWKRGITYCPDYVVNAGGVLSVAELGHKYRSAEALDRVATIGERTRKVLALASEKGLPAGAAADELARLRLRPSPIKRFQA